MKRERISPDGRRRASLADGLADETRAVALLRRLAQPRMMERFFPESRAPVGLCFECREDQRPLPSDQHLDLKGVVLLHSQARQLPLNTLGVAYERLWVIDESDEALAAGMRVIALEVDHELVDN